MTDGIVFTNARIVTRHELVPGSMYVAGGLIADLSRGGSMRRAALDLEGDFLLPGLVELHTDMLEKHVVPRPKVQWPVGRRALGVAIIRKRASHHETHDEHAPADDAGCRGVVDIPVMPRFQITARITTRTDTIASVSTATR